MQMILNRVRDRDRDNDRVSERERERRQKYECVAEELVLSLTEAAQWFKFM